MGAAEAVDEDGAVEVDVGAAEVVEGAVDAVEGDAAGAFEEDRESVL
ncbi:MAG: hypothetical protein Q8L08_05435 [Candidatus Nanopelagicaceae bacterium]|nr:hypothetical protein [Candidatus Nanopelagicaceae bacterium]